MFVVDFPYGKNKISYDFSNENFNGTLVSKMHGYVPSASGAELVRAAMAAPIGSPGLYELAKGKKKVVIIASDHTRPVPSKIIIPPMLEEIRSASPDSDITLLIATGCHRETKKEELIEKFGEEIVAKLPELLWELPGNQVSATRYRYHDPICQRFTEAFAVLSALEA